MGLFKELRQMWKESIEKMNAELAEKERGKQKKISANFRKHMDSFDVDYKRLYGNMDIALCFMDKRDSFKSGGDQSYLEEKTIKNFLYVLGCTCQARSEEVDEYLENIIVENEAFYSHIKKDIPRMKKMLKTTVELEEYCNQNYYKINDDIDDYKNKRLLNRKTFMREFHYFYHYDYSDFNSSFEVGNP